MSIVICWTIHQAMYSSNTAAMPETIAENRNTTGISGATTTDWP